MGRRGGGEAGGAAGVREKGCRGVVVGPGGKEDGKRGNNGGRDLASRRSGSGTGAR